MATFTPAGSIRDGESVLISVRQTGIGGIGVPIGIWHRTTLGGHGALPVMIAEDLRLLDGKKQGGACQ